MHCVQVSTGQHLQCRRDTHVASSKTNDHQQRTVTQLNKSLTDYLAILHQSTSQAQQTTFTDTKVGTFRLDDSIQVEPVARCICLVAVLAIFLDRIVD